jgi:hypothetical protein
MVRGCALTPPSPITRPPRSPSAAGLCRYDAQKRKEADLDGLDTANVIETAGDGAAAGAARRPRRASDFDVPEELVQVARGLACEAGEGVRKRLRKAGVGYQSGAPDADVEAGCASEAREASGSEDTGGSERWAGAGEVIAAEREAASAGRVQAK